MTALMQMESPFIPSGLGRGLTYESPNPVIGDSAHKIESIGIAQSILGRILGFGTIVISGTGGSKEPFHRIADPMMFRRRAQEQIAAMEECRDTRKEG